MTLPDKTIRIERDLNNIDREDWQRFITKHNKCNLFQSPEIIAAFKETNYVNPICVFGLRNGRILGLITGFLFRGNGKISGYLSSRTIVYGGPVVQEDHNWLINTLLNEFIKNTRKKCLYTQVRFTNGFEEFIPNLKAYSFKKIPYLNIIIPIADTEKKTFARFHKSRLRNYKKSLNKGCIYRRLKKTSEIEEGHKLVQNLYQKKRIPYPDLSHFLSLQKKLGQHVRVHFSGLYYNRNLIGFRVNLLFKDVIYDYYAASDPAHRNKYPNDVLIIELIKWGIQNQYKKFDFGGAGQPGVYYGVRNHKLNYSKDLLETPRLMRINNPLIYYPVKLLYVLYSKL